ncbi:MAG: hypothetical protein IKL20_07815 [Alistipes sp.]|nr:hypothetical protein [Alistipes sp.]
MKSVISKVLEGAMAQAVFDVSKAEGRCSLKDCLMLQILGATGSKGYRALASQLEGWQLSQLRLRLERFAYRMGRDTEAADEFYRAYMAHLAERFGKVEQITTLHAVTDILEDKTTLSSRLFEMYGVTPLFVK